MSATATVAHVSLPYYTVSGSGPIQPFGMLALAGLAAGVLLVIFGLRKRGVPGGDIGLIVPLAAIALIFGAHWFDIAWYRWDDASQDPKLWIRITEGTSVFGGVAGTALVVWALARSRKVELGVWADVTALGLLVGLTIGRIGCTLVHDHLGVPTDLPIGIDVPADQMWFKGAREFAENAGTVRMHDVGMEEFLLLVPLVIAAFVFRNRMTRPGNLAAMIAIGYVAIRFPLDFLRLPQDEPTRLGLTGGQVGCVMLLVATVILLAVRKPRRA